MTEPLERKPVRLRVEVCLPGGRTVPGTVLDLSRSGAFVELEERPEVGTSVELRFIGAGLGGLAIAARVARRGRFPRELQGEAAEHLLVRVPGVGVHFGSLAADVKRQIASFIGQSEARK